MRAAFLLLLAVSAGCVAAPPPELAAAGDADAWLAQEWGDATERVLVEDRLVVGKAPGRAGGVLTPGETLVLPGTQRVEVTITWPAGPLAPEELQLLFDSGGTAGRPEERAARNGEPVVIDGAGATDAAYQPHSHWWFGVFPRDDATAFPEMPVDVRIVGVRAATLPRVELPPPSSAPLVATEATPGRAIGPFCAPCAPSAWSSAPGAIVTNATALVRVTIIWDGETDAPGVVAWTPMAELIELEPKGEGVYEVVPPADALDSVYQTKSLWWFFLRGSPTPLRTGAASITAEAIPHFASG